MQDNYGKRNILPTDTHRTHSLTAVFWPFYAISIPHIGSFVKPTDTLIQKPMQKAAVNPIAAEIIVKKLVFCGKFNIFVLQ